ncbi:hypothetical protein PG993_008827 [Apiospora rasikravindrae]|uniref:Uncharacterized protein n=1 Tax=Apiospora rasikravindrae TaxID=990691 RepID=A0ABR1SRT3_9PEZI
MMGEQTVNLDGCEAFASQHPHHFRALRPYRGVDGHQLEQRLAASPGEDVGERDGVRIDDRLEHFHVRAPHDGAVEKGLAGEVFQRVLFTHDSRVAPAIFFHHEFPIIPLIISCVSFLKALTMLPGLRGPMPFRATSRTQATCSIPSFLVYQVYMFLTMNCNLSVVRSARSRSALAALL